MLDKLKKKLQITEFVDVVQERMEEAEITNSSVVVAYYLLLSLFPLLIAIGNVLPYLNADSQTVTIYLQQIIPKEVYSFLSPAINDLLTQSSGSLLSISAIAALWSASQSINALQTAMNRAYGVEKRGNFILVRLVSLFVLILFITALMLTAVIFGLGRWLIELLQPILDFPIEWIGTFQTLRWPVTLIALFIIMTLIFLVVPNARVSIRSVLPGAIFSTIGWMLLSQVFEIYTTFFAARVSSYQIIGSFIVLMLWLNLAAIIIIMGGIINAVVAEYTTGKDIEERTSIVEKIKEIGQDEEE